MEKKYINRFRSFQSSLASLAQEAVDRIVDWYLPKLEEFEKTAADYIAKMDHESCGPAENAI